MAGLCTFPFATCCLGLVPAVTLGPCHGKWSEGYNGSSAFGGCCAAHPTLTASWAFAHCLPAGRASLHDKASLRLEQVRSEDQGWYECKVLMLDQQYDTFHNGSWVHLTINGAYGAHSWGRVGGEPPGRLYPKDPLWGKPLS